MKKRFVIFFITTAIFCTGCSSISDLFSIDSKSDKDIVLEDDKKDNTDDILNSDTDAAEENKEPAMVLNKDSSPDSETNDIDAPLPEEENSFHGYVLSEEEINNPRVVCKETAKEDEVSIVFAGDINFDTHYANMSAFLTRPNGIYDTLNKEALDTFNNADIAMINNEFPYSKRGTPLPNKKFTFRADPKYVEVLNQMGIDIVSLANNHAYDHGEEALLDTFDTLDEAGIAYVGAGHNIYEAKEPFYFIAGGMKIAFVSATQIERSLPPDTKEATEESAGVLRTLEPEKFVDTIKTAEDNADFTIVYVHWGSENTYDVEQSQKDLAKAYVDAGADLIVGDHSHCLQGFSYINDVPILNSMGNFWFSSKDLDTGILRATLSDKKLQSLQFVPCRQKDCKTNQLIKDTDGDYERVLGVMVSLSDNVSIDEDGYVSNGAGTGILPTEPRPLKKASYQTNPAEIQPNLELPAESNGVEAVTTE